MAGKAWTQDTPIIAGALVLRNPAAGRPPPELHAMQMSVPDRSGAPVRITRSVAAPSLFGEQPVVLDPALI